MPQRTSKPENTEYKATQGRNSYPWTEWLAYDAENEDNNRVILSISGDLRNIKHPGHQTRLASLRFGIKCNISEDRKNDRVVVDLFETSDDERDALIAEYKRRAEVNKANRLAKKNGEQSDDESSDDELAEQMEEESSATTTTPSKPRSKAKGKPRSLRGN